MVSDRSVRVSGSITSVIFNVVNLMSNLPDIDIDLRNRDKLLELVRHIPASLDGTKKHNTGVYTHNIPFDPLTGVATLDYKQAEKRGYFKLDFLNNGVYDKVTSEQHLDNLINTEPDWSLLWLSEDFCKQITHVGKYHKLLCQMKPNSIEKMAMFLAIIRPAKRHLAGKSWQQIEKSVWDKPDDNQYFFKKSHSTSYAMLVAVHINLLVEQIENE